MALVSLYFIFAVAELQQAADGCPKSAMCKRSVGESETWEIACMSALSPAAALERLTLCTRVRKHRVCSVVQRFERNCV